MIGGVRLTRAFSRLIFGTPLPTNSARFCDKPHVLSRFGDAGYVLGCPFNDSYDLLDDENSLTLSALSLLRQSILFMAGKSLGGHGRGGGRPPARGGRGAQPGSNVDVIDALHPPPPSRP